MFATGYFLSGDPLSGKRIGRDIITTQALAQAKEALIGYAVATGNPMGSLPCPDRTNSGTAGSSCTSAPQFIGRLPWKKLGLGDVRDADGECLWYALSPPFKQAATINANTSGTITIKDESGATLANNVVAVVFAPGIPLATDDRTPSGATVCGGNTTTAAYLDAAGGIDNSTGNISGSNYTFVVAQRSNTFNDQLVFITRSDLFYAVDRRVAGDVRGINTSSTIKGLNRYFQDNGVLPWASPNSSGTANQQTGLTSGFVPYDDLYFQDSAIKDNGWLPLIAYQRISGTVAKLTLGGETFTYTCAGQNCQ